MMASKVADLAAADVGPKLMLDDLAEQPSVWARPSARTLLCDGFLAQLVDGFFAFFFGYGNDI